MSETMLLTIGKPKPRPTFKMDREEIIKSNIDTIFVTTISLTTSLMFRPYCRICR